MTTKQRRADRQYARFIVEVTMLTQSQEVRRLSLSLIGGGALMLIFGGSALLSPENILVAAMFLTAALAAVFGSYQIGIALRLPRPVREWAGLFHGTALVGLALLTVGLLQLPFRVLMVLIGLWLGLYSTVMALLTLALWPMRRTRQALFVWAMANFALALLAVLYRGVTIFSLLFFGAVYATVFGAFQIAAGIWIRHFVVPLVEPTIQSRWLTPHA